MSASERARPTQREREGKCQKRASVVCVIANDTARQRRQPQHGHGMVTAWPHSTVTAGSHSTVRARSHSQQLSPGAWCERREGGPPGAWSCERRVSAVPREHVQHVATSESAADTSTPDTADTPVHRSMQQNDPVAVSRPCSDVVSVQPGRPLS